MWITQFFLLIFLVIDTSHALPTKDLDDSPNVIVSINAHENATSEHGRSSEIRHPIAQSKPRILVSYGNVYKQTPVDPMQNLLMYFLMNVARDFAQDQDQFDRRRSPGFFSDAKSTFTDVTGKIVNGSKKIGQEIGESIRSISAREVPVESHYEETHYYPHIDGTCMCFNKLVRQRSQNDPKTEEMKRNLANEDVKASLEISTEKKSKDEVTAAQLKDEKTTELKTENHNVPVNNESSTIIGVENGQMLKENNNVVRVLKVLDLDHLKTNKAPIDTTTAPKQQIIKDVIDLKTMPQQENLNKRNLPIETFRPPLQPASLELPKNEILGDNKNKSTDDNGYYFLLSSGGTEKRTTASDIKNRELKNNENLLPKYEDETGLEIKRKRRTRAKRHMASRDRHHKTRIDILREKFRRRAKRHERRGKKKLKHDETENKFLARNPKLVNSDISVLMLPNVFNSNKHQLRSAEIEPPSRQKLLLTVTLPTIIGGSLVLLGLCYFLRARGWCCQLFMDKSNIVVVAVNENTRKESIAAN